MGLDTWYAFGPAIDESTVTGLADAMASDGLRAAGYRILWLDAGWWKGARDAGGSIQVDPHEWPHGLRWLIAYIHHRGLQAGIYTDLGRKGCGNGGSSGHFDQDAEQFAAWGFDAVKADFCGAAAEHLDPRTTLRRFSSAVRSASPQRPMLLSFSDAALPASAPGAYPSPEQSALGAFRYAPGLTSSWRTGPDLGGPGHVRFADVLRNLDLDARHPEVAGHGHWNDPDLLVSSNGLTLGQTRTQLSMWAIVAAPLVLSADARSLSPSALRVLTNPEAIAIDQDPLGVQGRVSPGSNSVQVWVKPLSDGEAAVALFNRDAHPLRKAVSAATAQLASAGAQIVVRDVWRRRSFPAAALRWFTVAPRAAVLLRVGLASSRSHLP